MPDRKGILGLTDHAQAEMEVAAIKIKAIFFILVNIATISVVFPSADVIPDAPLLVAHVPTCRVVIPFTAIPVYILFTIIR